MFGKNIANQSTFNNILVNNLEVQSSGVGLIIYDSSPLNPAFSFNPTTSTCTIDGELNVTGGASFETINISEYSSGMLSLGANNPGDTMDLGINVNYNDGTSKYTGIIRDASDSLKRWTFFKEITDEPTDTISGIDSTKLDSVRMNYLYVNSGTESTPSITFHNDLSNDTGFYLISDNNIGITAGGKKIANIKYNSSTDTDFQLDTTTNFKFQKINTIDDVASSTIPSITTGHFYIKSSSASDKWMKFYSYTNAATPSYSGAVFTSPNNNYFILNTGSNLEFVRNTTVTSDSSPPDYRDSTTTQLLVLSSSSLESKTKILIPAGSVSAPAISFSQETNTGLFSPSGNNIAIAINGVNTLNVASTGITATQNIRALNGTTTAPSYSFSSNTGTGILRDSSALYENITFSANGTSLGYLWLRTTPQWVMGSGGSAAIPSITWATDTNTGLFLPSNESATGQLSISLNTIEIARFRRRSGLGSGDTEFYNSFAITPEGSIKKALFRADDTRICNTFKTSESWFQAYNLIDTNAVFLFTFRSSGSVGKDYSNNAYDATLVNSPGISVLSKDANGVAKRDVLDLTGNTNKYLNLTSRLAALTSLDNAAISFWFRISGTLSQDNTIFSCYKTTGSKEISIKILSDADTYSNSLQITVMSDSLTTLQCHTATSADLGTPSVISVKDGLWHHVVIQFGSGKGGIGAVFFDGTKLSVATNTLYFTSNGTDNFNPEASVNSFDDLTFNFVSLGALFNGSTGTLYYTGHLKDFYLSGRVFSTDEISAINKEPYIYTYGIDAAVINVSQLNSLSSTYFIDGTASSPSISFTSNTNLGMYKSSSNVLGFATSGAERLTLSDNLFKYSPLSTGTFEIDGANSWLKLLMNPTGDFGPRIVFQYSNGTPARHSIRSSHHASTIANNFLDFYLFDTSGTDASGLGTNQVMRIGQTTSGSNTGLLTLYGIARAHDGTAAAPSYSFINSTGLGLYRVSANNLGIVSSGTVRIQVNTVVTIGTSPADITTRVYVPRGTTALPTYSFIENPDTGIFSSAVGNVDVTCGGVTITNFSSSGLLNQRPIIVDTNSTAALVIRQDGGVVSGDIFTVDTTNSRIGFGYTNLFMSRLDTYNSTTNQRLLFDSISTNTQLNGLEIYNSTYSTTANICSQIVVGKDTLNSNAGNVSFYYAGNGSTQNRLSLGIRGLNTNLLQIDGSNRILINSTTFEVSGACDFKSQIGIATGSATSPSYSFTGNLTTGIYQPATDQVGISTGGAIRQLITNDYTEFSHQIRLPAGSTSSPSITFSSDSANNTGICWNSENNFSLVCGGSRIITIRPANSQTEFNNECNFKPDGTNVRALITNKKMRLSSNQAILSQAPAIHLKFLSNPNTNTTTQDKSIFGVTVSINGTISYTTNTIDLTDASGTGLLNMSAIILPNDSSSYLQSSSDADLLSISEFKIIIKTKIIAFPSSGNGIIISLSGNFADNNNYFNFGVTSASKWFLSVRVNNVLVVDVVGTGTLTTNVWYSFIITCTTSSINVSINGVADATTANYAFNYNMFSDVSAPALRVGSQNDTPQNANCYIHEVLLQPTSTADAANSTYRTQAHEIYTNKLQITNGTTNLVDEGYLLISDKGNNATWDNSMQIYPGYIQFNSSKVLRAPNGTVSLPAYAFSSANDGMYLSGTNTISFATNGVQKVSISTTRFNVTSSANILVSNTTIPTSSSTGSLIVAGGIGLGNGSTTPSRINFGSNYTVANPGSNKLISLLDSVNNNFQFCGFGINTNILRYHVNSTSGDHIFYAATSSTAADELFRVKGTGVVHAQNGSVGAPSYGFVNDVTSGFYRIGSNNIGISTNGIKRLDISNSTTAIANNLELSAGFKRSVITISTTSATLDSTHNVVLCSYEADATNVVITLPSAATSVGIEYIIFKTGNGGGSLIINAAGSDSIDSSSSLTISSQYEKIILICIQSTRWATL